jgi:tricorn protease-like protein
MNKILTSSILFISLVFSCGGDDSSSDIPFKPVNFSNISGTGLVVARKSTCLVGINTIIVYDNEMQERYEKQFPYNRINSYVVTSSDDLIVGLEDGKIMMINLSTGDEDKVEEFFAPIGSLSLSPDESILSVVAKNNAVLFIEIKTRRIVMLNYDKDVLATAVGQDSKFFYIQLVDRIIKFNDDEKKVVYELPLERQ